MELVPLAKAVHVKSYPYDYWDACFDSQVDYLRLVAEDHRRWERAWQQQQRENDKEWERWLAAHPIQVVAAEVHPELPPAVAEDLLVRSLSFIENFRKVFGTQP